MAEKGQSIVIKKVKKGGGHGHHGGAWKVAYADFVTAMMCFFLVMWLMGSDEEIKAEIEHYFTHPNTPYNQGRDPASDTARPLGEEVGVGESILKGTNGILDDNQAPSPERSWAVENSNWRVKLESLLESLSVYGLQSTDESVRFSIAEHLIFEPNSATFKPGAGAHLDKIAKAIAAYPGAFIVTAHTSDRRIASEEFQTGWDLSSARSTMVLRYMIQKHGFNTKKISAIGFADQRPLLDNANAVNRELNNRVEFVLSRRAPAL